MRAALVWGMVVCASVGSASGQPVDGVSGETSPALVVPFAVTYSPQMLTFEQLHGCDVIRLEGCQAVGEVGRPALPTQTLRVALPAGMRVTGARATRVEQVVIPGTFDVLPIQPPRPLDGAGLCDVMTPEPAPDSLPGADRDAWVEFVRQSDLAGQGIAVLRVHPLCYTPGSGALTLATLIEFTIEGEPGWVCGDYLPASSSPRSRAAYARALEGLVANAADVALRSVDLPAAGLRVVAPGSYEHVIITHSSWVGAFQPLADWRTRTGIRSIIVTTDWIYNQGGYAGSNLEKVRGFVEDAHATWGAVDFLLGGDTHVIPCHVRTVTVPGYETADIPNDTYFADYDDDFVIEVNVGRASVRSTTHIATFIDKVLTYEQSPPGGGYVESIAIFGFDITTVGDQDGEICKEMIRGMHMPPMWTIDTEYDSEPGPHKADVIAYLNAGYHLVNHHDHCNASVMGTGWISHGDLLTIPDVNALVNGNRQSLCFAVGCNPCDTPTTTSIGEAFVLNPSGGGFAFIGNSRTGWGGPTYDPDWYTVRQDRFFYRNLFDDGIHRLGANFSDAKNDEYDASDPYNLHEYCFTQLHLLSDPAIPLWTAEPAGLSVTHAAGFPLNAVSFDVHVADGRGDLADATVCLWKGDEVHLVGTTDAAGEVQFSPDPTTIGLMYVTVTKHDYLPYEGLVDVGPAICHGDCNCDDEVDFGDINPFVDAMLCSSEPDPEACWAALHPACPYAHADAGADGQVGFDDINPFVNLLTMNSLPLACPQPPRQ